MSDRHQQGHRSDDLEAAEGLVALFGNPAQVAPRSDDRGENASSSSASGETGRDEGAASASGDAVRNEAFSASGTPTSQGHTHGVQPARPDTQQVLPVARREHQPQAAPLNPFSARRRESVSGEQALQAYLIRQQLIAGIPPDRMTNMRRRRLLGQESNTPGVVQITNNGLSVPEIPPAQFNGVFHPLPALPSGIPGDGVGGGDGSDERPPTQRMPPPSTRRNVPSQNVTPRFPRPVAPPNATQVLAHSGARRNIVPEPEASYHRPPPSLPAAREFLTQHARTAKFNLLHELTKHPEVFLEVIGFLDPSGLVNMQSTSKTVLKFVKGHYEDSIMSISVKIAPESVFLYPARCYPRLCIPIPKTGLLPPDRPSPFRLTPPKIPSIRWLRMISYREETTEIILNQLERSGQELPARCSLVIKKLWFLMDILDNKRRGWMIQNRNIWPDVDLYLGVLFLVKLEEFLLMINFGPQHNKVRCLLLAQKSMTLLRDVVCDKALLTGPELNYAYTRWEHVPTPDEVGVALHGVPPEEVGSLKFEGYVNYGHGKPEFQAPDEVLLRECVARNLDLDSVQPDYFFYDYRVPIYFGRHPGVPMGQETYREPTWVRDIYTDGRGKNMNRFDVVIID